MSQCAQRTSHSVCWFPAAKRRGLALPELCGPACGGLPQHHLRHSRACCSRAFSGGANAPPTQGRYTAPPGIKSQQATKPEAVEAPDRGPSAHLPPSRAGRWWQLVLAGHQGSRDPRDESLVLRSEPVTCTPATGVETDSHPPPTSGSRGSSGAARSRWEHKRGSPGPGSPGGPGPPAEHGGSS